MSDEALTDLFKDVKKIALSGQKKTEIVNLLKNAFRTHFVSAKLSYGYEMDFSQLSFQSILYFYKCCLFPRTKFRPRKIQYGIKSTRLSWRIASSWRPDSKSSKRATTFWRRRPRKNLRTSLRNGKASRARTELKDPAAATKRQSLNSLVWIRSVRKL